MRVRTLLVPLGLCALACGGADDLPAAPADQDVRGIYAVTWEDDFVVRLDIAGAVQEATVTQGEVVTFNAPDGSPLEFDLTEWCASPDVNCPSEVWPANVAIDQDSPELASDLHSLRVWDAEAGGAVVTGLVDHRNDQFLLGLDGYSGGSGSCGVVGLSLAGGTFGYDAPSGDTGDTGDTGGAEVQAGPVRVDDGAVAIAWLGVCAWNGLAVAATLSVESGYAAVRVGEIDEASTE